MWETSRVVGAPADLGVALARVPEGSDLHLSIRCESAVEGVWVTGTVGYRVEGECARCLEPIAWSEEASFAEMYGYPPTNARGARVDVDTDEDDPLPMVEDDLIDLEPMVRDAVVLGLPIAPVCDADCAGLCATCGLKLQPGEIHRHEQIDPRWAALAGLAAPSDDESDVDGPSTAHDPHQANPMHDDDTDPRG